MVKYMSQQVNPGPDGVWSPGGGLMQSDGSYLYANKRFFIPWGWYANPLGATSSTGWAVFYDWMYNPFELGGGLSWNGGNSTFFEQQCGDNKPDASIFKLLADWYSK